MTLVFRHCVALLCLTALLVACGEDSEPAVTAPTSKIAFVSDRDGYMRIYVMDPDGANQVAITDPPYGNDKSPAWSPGGA